MRSPSGGNALQHQRRHVVGAAVTVGGIDQLGDRALEAAAHDAAVRLRLYVEDERTVDVLLTHVQDRVVDDWLDFGALVAGFYGGALRGRVPGGAFVRERVARGCREDWRLDGAYTYAHEHEQGGSGVAGGTGGSR